ncbi:ankyrin repeat domain-containing protein [Aureicoccus marinus]|uniref:Uncharacterized protein n=1 Tax=Aureicoccus marinus TaxID=754435 RepID=A0A2S7T6U1_9FLAO|nr:ankyrin repeat domain-containing protein [Aureicoccus marinus]PQJ15630.1 hypothetical protein BST99_07725 [Aureicoccus marinus]
MRKVFITLSAIAIGSFGSVQAAEGSTLESTDVLEVSVVQLTPLCQAVVDGDVELVKQYIAQGVDLSQKSNGKAATHYAARYNKAEILHLLLEGGADLYQRCDAGYTVKRHAQLSNAKSALAVIKIAEKKRA